MKAVEFNEQCAKLLGIHSETRIDVFADDPECSRPQIFDAFYDANDLNRVVESLGIDTVLLRKMENPEWQCTYRLCDPEKIVIEVRSNIADAQRACIESILIESETITPTPNES